MNIKRHRPALVTAALVILGAGYFNYAKAAQAPRYQVLAADTGRPADSSIVRIVQETAAPAVVISQKNKTFSPDTASLRVGQVLEIVNDDQSTHNAYCQSGDFKYNAGAQPPGSSSQVVFTKAGVYEVRCAIHPKMLLKVTVAE